MSGSQPNVKVFCASPIVANHLLMERIFISNSRVVVTKDTQEPIRCNKCQEYGHIRKQCENAEWCSNCARPHPTTECNYPNDPHCVSCGTSSKHASSDKGSCPQFAKHASSINACLPENAMPYFPILGQPNTFVLAAKNTHVPTANYSNCPRPIPNTLNPPPQCQNPAQPPPPPNNQCAPPQQRLTQTMLGPNRQLDNTSNTNNNANASPSRPSDNRWNIQNYRCGPPRPNPNNIPLPQSQTLFQYGFVPNPPTQFQPVSQFFNPDNYANEAW